jgi:cation-transporting ATPase 13A1
VEINLLFAGFLVLHCPAKPESAGVLATLAAASHDLQMITGDQLLTACHTASQLGLTNKPQMVLTIAEQADTHTTAAAAPLRLSWRVLRTGAEGLAGPGMGGQGLGAEGAEGFGGTLPPPVEGGAEPPPVFSPTRASFRALADRYALCLDGAGFDALGEAGALGAAMPFLSVLARMAPQQKERALLTLKGGGVHALMCGDGTNDVGELCVGWGKVGGGAGLARMAPQQKERALLTLEGKGCMRSCAETRRTMLVRHEGERGGERGVREVMVGWGFGGGADTEERKRA